MSEASDSSQRPVLFLVAFALVVAGILLVVYLTPNEAFVYQPPDAGQAVESAVVEEAEGVDDGCGICPADRPHCDHGEGRCVACEAPEHCTGPLTACMNGVCVECETSRDCDSLEMPECYFGTHACRACTSDDACLFRGAASHCIEGRCSEASE